MKQQILASNDFESFRKPVWREQFPAEMDKVVPWRQLFKLIARYYPRVGNGM